MICKGCGKELSSDQIYCPNCGCKNEVANSVKNTKRCIKCGKEFPEDRYYCNVCGGDLVLIMPASQTPPIQPIQNQMPPYSMPQNQSISGQIPPMQTPPYPMQQGPVNPNAPYPMQQGPINPNAPYPQATHKKANPAIIIVIILVVLIFLAGGIFAIYKIGKSINDKVATSDISNDATTDTSEDTTTNDTGSGDSTVTDTPTDSADESTYNLRYSYSELPDVISLDSDSRFVYNDNSSYDGVATYTYQFNSITSIDSDFYDALDQYSEMLVSANGFCFEEDFSNDQYESTGEATEYLTKDNMCISVTGSIEDTGYYATIAIIPMSNSSTTTTFDNYTKYIEGRTEEAFDFGSEIHMDNGLVYRLNSVNVTDLGDGTVAVDVNIDLAADLSDWYLYTDDFLVLPTDVDGNILSDACVVNFITDSSGNDVTTPLLLDTEYYSTYKLTYIIPAVTNNFTFYASNITEDSYYDPIYSIDLEVNDY